MMNDRWIPYVIANYINAASLPTWINYFPRRTNVEEVTYISVDHGMNRSYPQGPCLESKEMLEFVMGKSIWKEIEGTIRYMGNEYEPPGWFRRQCEAAGCLWFYGLVEHMAAGEEIPIEEIKIAYRENNGGKELEQKPYRELT